MASSNTRETKALTTANNSKFRKNFNDTFAFSLWLRNLAVQCSEEEEGEEDVHGRDAPLASTRRRRRSFREHNDELLGGLPYPKDLVLCLVDFMQEKPGAAGALADRAFRTSAGALDSGESLVAVSVAESGGEATTKVLRQSATRIGAAKREQLLQTMGCNCMHSTTDVTHSPHSTPSYRRAFAYRSCPGVRYVKFIDSVAAERSGASGVSHKLACGGDFTVNALPDFGLGCLASCSFVTSRHLYFRGFPSARAATLSHAMSRAHSFLRGVGAADDTSSSSSSYGSLATEQLPNFQMLLLDTHEPWETIEMFFCFPEAVHVLAACMASAVEDARLNSAQAAQQQQQEDHRPQHHTPGLARLQRLVISCVAGEVLAGMRSAWMLLASSLSVCPDLRYLVLEEPNVAPSELRHLLSSAVKQCPKLHVISISGESLVDACDVVRTITCFGGKHTTCQPPADGPRGAQNMPSGSFWCRAATLELIMCNLSNNDCESLFSLLSGVRHLRKLDLSHNRIAAQSLEALAKSSLPDLQCLVLDGHNFSGSACVSWLCNIVLCNPQLSSLGLGSCDLGEHGVHQILCAAKSDRRTGGGATTTTSSASLLSDGKVALLELHIARNKLVGKDCRHITNALLPADNSVVGQGGKPAKRKDKHSDPASGLLAAVAAFPCCNLLSLSGNRLGTKGAEAIAPLFVHVRHLYLDYCELSAEGLGMLASFAEKHCQKNAAQLPLETLSLASNGIALDGIAALGRLLKYAPQLCYLNLSDNGFITAAAWRSLVTTLFGGVAGGSGGGSKDARKRGGLLSLPCLGASELTYVDLSNNTIDGAELEQFRRSTGVNDPLTFLISTLARQYADAIHDSAVDDDKKRFLADVAGRRPFPFHHFYDCQQPSSKSGNEEDEKEEDEFPSFSAFLSLPRLGTRVSTLRDLRLDRYLDGVLTFRCFSCVPEELQPFAAALAQHHAELRLCFSFVY